MIDLPVETILEELNSVLEKNTYLFHSVPVKNRTFPTENALDIGKLDLRPGMDNNQPVQDSAGTTNPQKCEEEQEEKEFFEKSEHHLDIIYASGLLCMRSIENT